MNSHKVIGDSDQHLGGGEGDGQVRAVDLSLLSFYGRVHIPALLFLAPNRGGGQKRGGGGGGGGGGFLPEKVERCWM